MDISKALNSVNIAEDLDDQLLVTIGEQVVKGFETDEASVCDWRDHVEDWTKMALQISEEKSFPWPKASNIKFPLLSTAAMQFAARAYPTLVPSDGKVVKCRTIGSDPTGEKTARAIRVSKHMSYQVLCEMEEWEEEMDRLLVILPIVGTVFKKTYYDPEKQRNVSCLVMPKNLVVNYWTKTLEDCERITEVHEFSQRKVKEKQNRGLYLDIDLGHPVVDERAISQSDPNSMVLPEEDDTTPYTILEQHCFLDLDEDGYSEPYVVIVEKDSRKVLRISPRFTSDSVVVDEKGSVIAIDPVCYFTKFSFFPNPDGGFYDMGFGRLLGPINASVDTLINQLIDAGSLSNLQTGFIGKGLRIKMGEARFTPGEWKAVNATGADLKQQIFPLPVREPSAVLFKLLELLSASAKELASIAEIFVGKMPGQNTPATTTMASVEQGMKLFTAVYKRVYRSMAKEFQKLYKLNQVYLNPQEETEILDEPIQQSDYQGNEKDIYPAADPNAASSQERLQKAQNLMQIMQMGTIDPMEVTMRLLEAMEEPNIEKLIKQPQQQGPSPEQQQAELEMKLKQAEAQTDMQSAQAKMQMAQADSQQKLQMKAQMHQMDLAFKQQEAVLKGRIAALEGQQKLQAQSSQNAVKLHGQVTQQRVKAVASSAANAAKAAQSKESKPSK